MAAGKFEQELKGIIDWVEARNLTFPKIDLNLSETIDRIKARTAADN